MTDEKNLFTTMESVKSAHKRIDSLEKKVDGLTELHIAVCRIAEKVDGVAQDVSEVKEEMKEVRDKPAHRWEKLVGQVMALLVAALIGMALSQMGL